MIDQCCKDIDIKVTSEIGRAQIRNDPLKLIIRIFGQFPLGIMGRTVRFDAIILR